MHVQSRRQPIEPVPTKECVLGLLHELKRGLIGMGVTDIAIFGSVARGDANAGSDVDFAVKIAPGRNGLMVRGGLGCLLARRLGRTVDVVPYPLRPPLCNVVDEDDLVWA